MHIPWESSQWSFSNVWTTRTRILSFLPGLSSPQLNKYFHKSIKWHQVHIGCWICVVRMVGTVGVTEPYLSVSKTNRQRASKPANDAIDLSVSEEAASICVECALSPVDRHSAFKCGLAQRGASFCWEEMLNTEDVRDTLLRATLLPIQEAQTQIQW